MKSIVVSNEKGGIGKTFTCFALGNILSTDSHPRAKAAHHRRALRVLVVDLDQQGHSTLLLTGKKHTEFEENVMTAMAREDANNSLYEIHENLSMLPGTSKVATFEKFVTQNNIQEPAYLLNRTLEKVADQFDICLIDTNPTTSLLNMQALNVTLGGFTNMLIPMQTEKLGYTSVLQFVSTLKAVQSTTNPNLRILGIQPILLDQTSIDHEYVEKARASFKTLTMSHVVHRRAELKRMAEFGFSEHYAKQRQALTDYYLVAKEVVERVQ